MDTQIISVACNSGPRNVRERTEESMHQNIKKKRTQNTPLRRTKRETTGRTVCTTEEHARGPVTEVSPNPPQKITLDPEISKLIQNNVPIRNIKSTLKVNKSHYTVTGEARIQINEAVVCAALGKETK